MKKIDFSKFNDFVEKLKKSKFFSANFNFLEICLVMIMTLFIGFTAGEIVFNNFEFMNDDKIIVTSDKGSLSGDLSDIENVYNIITGSYYGDVDKEALIDGAIDGMMEAVGDDYSVYYNEYDSDQFESLLSGSFIGMGVQIGRDAEGNVVLSNVFAESPAAKAGINSGDYLLEVNGEDTDDYTVDQIVSMIKGVVQEVNLVIESDGVKYDKVLKTGVVEIPSVTSKVFEENGKKTGYIFLNIFAENTDEQFSKELFNLEKANIDNLIIDVRDNTGGHLSSVKNIANMFLDSNQIIYQIESKKSITKTYGTDKESRDYDIVVLVNEYSASGSEVLAAALKEEYGSILVGKKTYGKGSVQKVHDLDNGGFVKLTSELWLTSLGNSIQDNGVEVDVEVELDSEYYDTRDDEDDNQLQKALEIINK